MALCLAACAFLHSARADSSFLLIQGAFGAGGSEATFKFRIDYPPGALSTGQNLLDSVFGTPVLDGTDSANGQPLYFAGTAARNVQYDHFSFGDQVVAFTFNSVTIKANDTPASGPTQDWAYYVAGGAGQFNGGPYSSGSWNFANDGQGTRTLATDSFDGWVFGSSGFDSNFSSDGSVVTINGAATDNAPTDADFANAFVISIPEPRGTVLLLGGMAVLWFWKRRRRG